MDFSKSITNKRASLLFVLIFPPLSLLFNDSPPTKFTEFHFKCNHSCHCLPKPRKNVRYFHQSVVSRNESTWSPGWRTYRESWKRHPWVSIIWTDKENDLLAKCLNATHIYDNLDMKIKRADMSRLLYMYHYGGFYVDLDYFAFRDHEVLFQNSSVPILIGGDETWFAAMEWIFSKERGHPFWKYCLEHKVKTIPHLIPEYATGYPFCVDHMKLISDNETSNDGQLREVL